MSTTYDQAYLRKILKGKTPRTARVPTREELAENERNRVVSAARRAAAMTNAKLAAWRAALAQARAKMGKGTGIIAKKDSPLYKLAIEIYNKNPYVDTTPRRSRRLSKMS